MILIWSAPWRISSRTARRTSSGPSASDSVKAMALQQRHGGAPSVRRRGSLWPPVGPMARPEMNRRGPGRSPPSTAALMPQSAPPVSRTVVKPRSIMPRISGAARAVMSVSGMCSRFRMFTSLRYTCTWQSISPGMSVRPPPSITVAPAALIGRSETSRISSPSTSTSRPPSRRSWAGSSSSTLRKRYWVIGHTSCRSRPRHRSACRSRHRSPCSPPILSLRRATTPSPTGRAPSSQQRSQGMRRRQSVFQQRIEPRSAWKMRVAWSAVRPLSSRRSPVPSSDFRKRAVSSSVRKSRTCAGAMPASTARRLP